MAEGWARHLLDQQIDAYSAGIEKHGLNPLAVRVMSETGVDISGHQSNTMDELPIKQFDLVITLCGHAHETCPFFPGKTIHQGFEDPPALARDAKTEKETLEHYRRVRDEIRELIIDLPTVFNELNEK